jgi:hypothetical protein
MTLQPRTHRHLAPALAFAVVLHLTMAGVASAAAKETVRSRTWTITFQADTLGQAPPHADVLGGDWAVVEDSTAETADSTGTLPLVLRQREGDEPKAAHSIRFGKPSMRDGEVSTRFRIVSGELDPSVGIMSHLDAKGRNGYLVRVSGARSELIAHYFVNGKRRDLKFQKIEPPALGTWHTLALRREGVTLTVLYDGVRRMQLRDERYVKGVAGLWTEDDTVADFSEVSVTVQ